MLYNEDSDENIMDEAALPAQVKPHPDALSRFTLSRAAERFAYRGAQTMLIYYLMDKYAASETSQGYALFSWLIFGFAALQVVGGLLTDLLIDARKAVVWGGLALAVGYFVLGFDTPITDVAGGLLILGGAGIYTPASVSALGRYYRGREQYLLAGMHTYQAGIFIGWLLASLFFSLAMQFIDWRQGLMLCGIVMILGHIYLLAISKAFTEPYLPANVGNREMGTYSRIIPAVLLITCGLFYLLSNFSFDSGGYKKLLASASMPGIQGWLHYMRALASIILLLAGSWVLTRKQGSAARRLGAGALAGVALLVGGIGALSYGAGSASNPALVFAVIIINVLMGAVEVYFVPALFTLILQRGMRAVNTWIGLLAMAANLPYLMLTLMGGATPLGGMLTVVATIGLTSAGLWFIKNRKHVDLPEKVAETEAE